MSSEETVPDEQAPVEMFYCYADADQDLLGELEKHLSLWRRDGLISTWHKRQITAGADWTKDLNEHLNTALVVLLLVSSDFIASDYCYGIEMQRAMERHEAGEAHIIPILLRPCDRQNAPFGKFQVLPSNGRPVTSWPNHDEAFVDIVQGIRIALGDSPLLASTTNLTTPGHSSLSPHSSDSPRSMQLGEHNKFNSIYLTKIIEEHGVTLPDTNLRSPMKPSRNPLRSLIRSLAHLKIAPRQASWHEEEIAFKRQTYDGTRKITAWLAAEGDVTYVVDSITISHRTMIGPRFLSAESGAVLPDAQYQFPIIANSTKTYALNPALVLSHEDRREVSFSLKLIPPKKEANSGFYSKDPVNVVLHYHTFDGTQGKLSLAPPPEGGVVLSQLLKADVEMNGLVICPTGCQRGVDENAQSEQIRELFLYEPLMFPDIQLWLHLCSKNNTGRIEQDKYLHYLCSEEAPLLFSLTPERQILNKAIEEKGIHLQKLLMKAKDTKGPRRDLLFNLCAGLPFASCEQALLQIGTSEIAFAAEKTDMQTPPHERMQWYSRDILDAVVGALAIRHVLQPSETLADFLLRLPHARLPGSATHAAFAALIIRRKGKWLQALTALHKVDQLIDRDILEALLLIRDNLTNEERHIADELAREQSESFLKLDTIDFEQIYHTSTGSAIKYLLQTDSSALEVRERLLEWESALPHIREYPQLAKNEFKRWIKSLLDGTTTVSEKPTSQNKE